MTKQSLIKELESCSLNHNDFYKLSLLKEWAKANDIPYLERPSVVSLDNFMAVFPVSYSPSYKVYIHKGGESVDISAV